MIAKSLEFIIILAYSRTSIRDDDPPGLSGPQWVVAIVDTGIDGEVTAVVHTVAGGQNVVLKDEGTGARPGSIKTNIKIYIF